MAAAAADGDKDDSDNGVGQGAMAAAAADGDKDDSDNGVGRGAMAAAAPDAVVMASEVEALNEARIAISHVMEKALKHQGLDKLHRELNGALSQLQNPDGRDASGVLALIRRHIETYCIANCPAELKRRLKNAEEKVRAAVALQNRTRLEGLQLQ